MVKFYASAKFAVDTKNYLKFIFQCGIGVYHKLNEENMLCFQLVTEENHKQYQTLCKDFTEMANEKKILRKHTSKISKKKIFPL